jgi:hypothetical protein
MLSPPVSELIEKLHPLRLPYETLAVDNPLMVPVIAMADEVRKNSGAGSPGQSVHRASGVGDAPDRRRARRLARHARRHERIPVSDGYGSPILQAALGIDPADARRPRLSGTNPLYNERCECPDAEIRAKIAEGGIREAAVRALIYIAMPRAAVDERAFQAIRGLRARQV